MRKVETYKGFKITYTKHSSGFNMWNIRIQKSKFKGTRREKYYLKNISTYQSKLSEAKEEARFFINTLQRINWQSSGLENAKYLPK